MSSTNRNDYNFIFNIQDADAVFSETELGNVEPKITISVSATNERRAMIAALALIKTLKVEHFADQFEKAMNSGDYTTHIEQS